MVTRNHVFTTDNDGSQEDGNPSSRSCPNKQQRLNENNDTKRHNKQDRILTKDVPESFIENIVYDELFSLSKNIESIVHIPSIHTTFQRHRVSREEERVVPEPMQPTNIRRLWLLQLLL